MASRTRLQAHLRRETDEWAAKSFETLRAELRDVVAYERGGGDDAYQVEVQLLEDEEEYLHVGLAVDDGGWRAFAPFCSSFLVYRDGRVDK